MDERSNLYPQDYDNVAPEILWVTVRDALEPLRTAIADEIRRAGSRPVVGSANRTHPPIARGGTESAPLDLAPVVFSPVPRPRGERFVWH